MQKINAEPEQPGFGHRPGFSSAYFTTAFRRMTGRSQPPPLTISPGIIDTEMGAAADAHTSGETKAAMRGKIPLGRDGTMAEISDAVEFPASPRARYITGTDLLIDGGLIAGLLFPNEAP